MSEPTIEERRAAVARAVLYVLEATRSNLDDLTAALARAETAERNLVAAQERIAELEQQRDFSRWWESQKKLNGRLLALESAISAEQKAHAETREDLVECRCELVKAHRKLAAARARAAQDKLADDAYVESVASSQD